MSQANDSATKKIASAAGGIKFGSNAEANGDAFTGGRRVIQTERGAYVGGSVNTGGGAFIGRDRVGAGSLEPEAIAGIFAPLYAAIEQHPTAGATEKGDLIAELRELQYEVGKGDQAELDLVKRRLRSVGRLAPDILALLIATLADPVAGFNPAVVETAEHMRASLQAG